MNNICTYLCNLVFHHQKIALFKIQTILRLEIQDGGMKEPGISGSQGQVTAKLTNSVFIRSERTCLERT